MSRIARAVVLALLITTALATTGCLHTWTGTHQEWPPSVNDPPREHQQGNPSDG